MKPNTSVHLLVHDAALFQLAASFLSVPALIYLLGFVQWNLAVPLTTLLVASWWMQQGRMMLPEWRMAVLAMAGALLVLVVTGFPDGPFAWDWIKHWALINALADHDWPVTINLNGEAAYLRFYVGAYLVPALASKWVHIPTAIGTPIWFGCGFALILAFVIAIPGHRGFAKTLVCMLAFLCMAGADAWAGMAVRAISSLSSVGLLGIHHEWWFDVWSSVPLQFGSMLTSLVWVPHQSIATFLVSGLLVFDRSSKSAQRAVFSMAVLALWSPYGLLGLIPLAALRLPEIWRCRRDWPMWATMLFAISFVALVGISLLDDMPQGGICFSCLPIWLSRLQECVLFWFVELCVFMLVLGRRIFTNIFCAVSVATLIFLPFLAGSVPDFVMRASMGPLFVLSFCSARAVTSWLIDTESDARSWGLSTRVALALLLEVPTILGEVSYHSSAGKKHLALPSSDPLANRGYYTFAQSSTITVDEFFAICGWSWRQQYFIDHLPTTYRQPAHAE